MNEDLILTLQNYGFSEKEAKVYLTALSLGAAPASSIARNANETRTTVYSVLGDLVKKGYCSSVVRENVTYFSAVSPEMLVKIQEQKYQEIKEKLPEFMAIGSVFGGLGKIKTFEGKNALKNLFLELTTTEIDVKSFQGAYNIEDYPDFYPEQEIKNYRRHKIENGLISYRIISRSDRLNQKLEDSEDKKEKHKRYTLVVDDINMDSKSTIHVFGPNKVSVSFLENNYPYVIVIENIHLFSYLSSLFDYVRNSKNLNTSKS